MLCASSKSSDQETRELTVTTKVHSNAIIELGAALGEGTRVWAFVHILSGARIGADCNICDHVFIENDVVVGDRVTIKSGVQLWDGARIGDDVFIGPNATFTNDRFPRSKQYPVAFLPIIVKAGASIGANATLLPGVVVERNAMVGAGAVVTRNVPSNAIVVGNPARIVGYVPTHEQGYSPSPESHPPQTLPLTEELGVGSARLFRLPQFRDIRGSLAVAELSQSLPFQAKRCFIVFDVPGRELRGEHAHKELHQFLVCVKGQLHVALDDGNRRTEVVLDGPGVGLHIPPRVWGIQYQYSPDAVLVVLASDIYDADDYLRDYEEFLDFVRSEPGSDDRTLPRPEMRASGSSA